MEFIPKYIKTEENMRGSEQVSYVKWNSLFNLLINQGDYNTDALVALCKELEGYSNTEEVIKLLNERVTATGAADMQQAVYDKNSDGIIDVAAKTVDNGVTTNSIANGAVTQDKLESILSSRINYMYENISKLWVATRARDNIQGTANLKLFGLDGLIGYTYNAIKENFIEDIYTEGLEQGTQYLIHENQNLPIMLGERYTVTNNSIIHNTKITSNSNATLTMLDAMQNFNSTAGNNNSKSKVIHVTEDYFCIVSENNAEHTTIHLVQFDSELNLLNTIKTLDVKGVGILSVSKLQEQCNIVLKGVRDTYCYVVAKTGITMIGQNVLANITDFCFSTDKTVYSIQYTNDDVYHKVIYKNNIVLVDLGTNLDATMFQLTAKWALIKAENRATKAKDSYWLDLTTGRYLAVSALPVDTAVYDPDGEHFYYNNAKYSCSNNQTVSKVMTISNELPIPSTMVNDGVLESDRTLYRIKNNKCKEIFNLKAYDNTIQHSPTANYTIQSIATNDDETLAVVTFGSADTNTDVLVKCFKFTRGVITLTSVMPEAMTAPAVIQRQQICQVPTAQIKQIYLNPEFINKTYNKFNLKLNFNRVPTSEDIITVDVYYPGTDGVETSQTLAMSGNSTDLLKDYTMTLASAVAYMKIIVTIKANNTSPLEVIEILGGVDNG